MQRIIFINLFIFHSFAIFGQNTDSPNLGAKEGGKKQSNKHFWYTLETDASPEKIWQIWTDVTKWKDWDSGLKDAMMEESFQKDAKGKIVSLDDRKSKFKIVEFEEGISYTFKVRLFLGSLYVKRYLEEVENKTRFTHEVWFTGITKGIFGKSLGKDFREILPEVLENIKRIAENEL